MADLPELFVHRMQDLLKEEWNAFLQESESTRQYGLRVNTLKISTEEFERIAPFHLRRIPWIDGGYYYDREDQPARHPFYAAGLYYLQEPSAMTPASRLPVFPGDKVLDLCAAPGGKATALAAGLSGRGLIVANDINGARARALLRNMELFGVTNSLITNEAPHTLARKFPAYFDKIMVDAPCSGEGMFRKNPAVMESWKEKGPEYFSALQREIILHGADMLKPGGVMFYSTCTFAPEENEGVITHLLANRPEMEVIPMEDYEGFSPGISSFAGQDFHESCCLCRRIWPHHMEGEGHFLALLRKRPAASAADRLTSIGESDLEDSTGPIIAENQRKTFLEKRIKGKPGKKSGKRGKNIRSGHSGHSGSMDKEQKAALDAFFFRVHRPDFLSGLDIRADKVYYVGDRSLEEKRLHFLRNGLYLGDLKKKRFEPSQSLALALTADDYDNCLNLPAEDERVEAYLRGESIAAGDDLESGWILLLADGYPLGWGKLVGTILKNKYPAGWRR